MSVTAARSRLFEPPVDDGNLDNVNAREKDQGGDSDDDDDDNDSPADRGETPFSDHGKMPDDYVHEHEDDNLELLPSSS